MVIPVGGDETQEMIRITKRGVGSGEWDEEKFGDYSFVPMLGGRQMR